MVQQGKWKVWSIVFGFLAIFSVALLFFFVWPRNKEPEYQGKTLSQWVMQNWVSGLNPSQAAGAQEAIRHIGTNALPCLIRWIQYERPAWKAHLWALMHRIPLSQAQRKRLSTSAVADMTRATQAETAFHTLGATATPAVPELSRLMFTSRNRQISQRAMHCLAAIGPAGLPPLTRALTNFAADSSFRENAVAAISELDTNALPLVPVLVQWLEHTNRQVASVGIMALGELGLRPELSVPALTNKLSDAALRRDSIEALGSFEKDASSAVPLLINFLSDTNVEVAATAASALGDIGECSETVLRELVKLLIDHPSQNVRAAAAAALEEFGAKASPAVPALRSALNHKDHEVRDMAQGALDSIQRDIERTNDLLKTGK